MSRNNQNDATTPEKPKLAAVSKTGVSDFPAWQWRQSGQWNWRVNRDFISPALVSHLAEPSRLLTSAATMLKDKRQASGTLVVQMDFAEYPTTSFVLKQYRPRNFWYGLKEIFRPSRAQQAFDHAFRLQQLGIETASPVSAAQRRCFGWPGEGYLLTTFVPDAVTLLEFDRICTDSQKRRRILFALAKLLATLHNARFSHADPGLSNFLVVQHDADDPKLVLIDLDGVRRSGPLPARTQMRDLRQFLKHSAVSLQEHRWFLAQYCRSRTPKLSAHDLVRTIRSGPGLETPREFGTKPIGCFQWVVRLRKISPQVDSILLAPDEFLNRAKVLKPSRSSAVSVEGGLVLKRDNYCKWTSRLKDAFRPSRGLRCFQRAFLLEIAGIRTAAPIAATESRCGRIVLRSYFLMAEIPGAVPLQFWTGNKQIAIERVARLLAKLHREGFTHRDLKGGNIVFDSSGQPHLIDLDGLRCGKSVSMKDAVNNLSRLARDMETWGWQLSRTQRVRFLLAYCRARRFTDWRWWWRAIEKRNA